ncbi:MAG: anhydro-N-acetylmuramic acid kinase [Burkholderiales bacterium]|jgi:anhydro-N-acetylmuramic acid kinase
MRPPQATPLTIGLMSGTSLDGIDGALVRWHEGRPQTLAFQSLPMPSALRAELLALQAPAPDELHRSRLAAIALARAYAEVCEPLIREAHAQQAIRAGLIGAHGQTVRHQPDQGYTVQLLDGALLAELTGWDVVCDFRSADIAAGGQGAPLVPAFHAEVFGQPGERRAIVNLGGIANVSLLAGDGTVLGHDTGPANLLLDLWASRVLGTAMDIDGALAARGRPHAGLLARLLADPYFSRPAPKSTGRDLFTPAWLDAALRDAMPDAQQNAADVQATLLELTAVTVARDCRAFGAQAVFLCGGGAANPVLVRRLTDLCAPATVDRTEALGAPAQAVEAVAFAWLARQRLQNLPGNLPSVTGASGPRVLGAMHRGRQPPA